MEKKIILLGVLLLFIGAFFWWWQTGEAEEEIIIQTEKEDLGVLEDKGQEVFLEDQEKEIVETGEVLPAYRSLEEEKDSQKESFQKEESCLVDINLASLEELQIIVGVGPTIAQRIIDTRPFYSLKDLLQVSGIGEITLQNIKDQGCAFVEFGDQLKEDEKEKEDQALEKEKEDVICQDGIDINTATLKELVFLPGVGEVIAQRIIDTRPFYSLESLMDVSGIGPTTLEDIKNQGCAFVDLYQTDHENETPSLTEPKEDTKPEEKPGFEGCKEGQSNINSATKEELMEVENIGDARAQAIIDERENELFKYLSDITRIYGIGEVILNNFMEANFCADELKEPEEEKEEEKTDEKEDEKEQEEDQEPVLKENLLANEFFEEWSEGLPVNWSWGYTLNRIGQDGDPLVGQYNVWLEPVASHNTLTQTISGDSDLTYYGQIWVKGSKGVRVRVGIAAPGYSYGEYVELEGNEWVKVTHSRVSGETENVIMVISVLEGEDGERPRLFVGAAWLGTFPPPEDWF